ncbi:MAG: hypothetical protein MRY83_12945, partial [Flavobacteriales bacterium]|nr:hypothetical protein [Flavobacteriales bacterium]
DLESEVRYDRLVSKKKSNVNTFYLKASSDDYAVGWVHNTTYWWGNLKNQNDCIGSIANRDGKIKLEDSDTDNYDYYEFEPIPIEDALIRLKISRKSNYRVRWFSTLTGDELNKFEQNISGSEKIKVPPLGPSVYDYAFIIEKK